MGGYWFSQAEVVTTEPEIVKELILQIANEEYTAPVCNLEIKGNSIFFDSDGYGCFGVEREILAVGGVLLFQRLFQKYIGALICFEAVSQYQGAISSHQLGLNLKVKLIAMRMKWMKPLKLFINILADCG